MLHNKNIFETLFKRKFSDPDNLTFLQEFTNRYPYFAPAQFFLLQQLQNTPEAYQRQALKTNLFFNNPHWLNFQLTETNKPVSDNTPGHIQYVDATNSTEENQQPNDTELPDSAGFEPETELEPMRIELKIPETSNNPKEAMLFEPMHMVDYFASQGIKLSEEAQNADKLGKQLKSFTAWLKTMKKIHVETDADIHIKPDTNVQIMAENSNMESEVLTESMAEVFARQGKIGKAKEVYQKLSLLNPAKSTYFAAKLENLNGL